MCPFHVTAGGSTRRHTPTRHCHHVGLGLTSPKDYEKQISVIYKPHHLWDLYSCSNGQINENCSSVPKYQLQELRGPLKSHLEDKVSLTHGMILGPVLCEHLAA